MKLKQALSNSAGTARQTISLWPEFANIIGVGRNSVYAAARRGDFRTIRIGKKIVVPKAEVRRLLGESEISAMPPSLVAETRREGK
jgi:hypothetical protein